MNQYNYNPPRHTAKKGGKHIKPPAPRKRSVGRVIFVVILSIVVALCLVGILVFRNLFNKIGSGSHADTDGINIVATITPSEKEEEPVSTPTPTCTPRPLTEEEIAKQEELALMASLQEQAEELISSDDVYNILLLGSDGRSETIERSDAMIMLSINSRTKTMWLTSFMRDTQVSIPGWGIGHLNWATSFGGVETLINTLEDPQNFAVDIDNWAMVDFIDFVDIAEMLGPITVSVKAEEAHDINMNIREVCQLYDEVYGLSEDNAFPRSYFSTKKDNIYTISNGAQILGYCRERHFGGDTGRSEKQRDVLTQFWNNIQKMSLKDQYAVAEKIMSIVKTDISMGKCASLLLKAPQYVSYGINAQQCPTEGAFCRVLDDGGLSIYNADFQVNRNFLQATIYGKEMSAQDLTSYWTGSPILVVDSSEK